MDLPSTALPARYYTDPDVPAQEETSIFRQSWQLVGHRSQLAGPGDHVVDRIGRLPLIVLRDPDRKLRAFHNVCRHRAGPLATCNGRGARALVCHYHGWTYGLDGRLLRAPEMDDAVGFDPDAIRLPEVSVAVWHGLVFAAAGPVPEFEQVCEGMDQRVEGRGLEEFAFQRRVTYDIACNWKVYVDNFLEGYHVPRVHPELSRLLDYRSYRTELARWHSLQWSPLESGAGPYGSGEALYYYIWPNTMLNLLPGRLQTNRVIPLDPGSCRVVFDYFYPKGTDADSGERDAVLSDEIQREDIAICESVQHGLASGSYAAGTLHPRRESGVAHFHQLFRQALALGAIT